MSELAPWDRAKQMKEELAPWDRAKQRALEVPKQTISGPESMWTGVQDVGTFGMSPLAAGVGAGAGSLYSDVVETGNLDGALLRAYDALVEARKERADYQKAAYQANPKSYMAGGLIGGGLSGPLLGAQQLMGKAPLLTKLGQAAKTGAKAGAVYGTGSAAGSAQSLPEAAGTIGASTLIGGGLAPLPVLGGAAIKGAAAKGKQGADFLRKLFRKDPVQGKAQVSLQPEPTDMSKIIRSDRAAMMPTEQTRLQNLKYKAEGLEPLTPVQQQPKAYGEPTPHQYVESYLKARSPKLYEKQLKQVESYEKALDKFRKLGAETKEGAGVALKGQIDQGKKIAGKTIAQYKDKAALKEVRKLKIPKVDDDTLQIPIRKGENVLQRLEKVKNYKDLDDLISDIGTARSQMFIQNGYQNSRDTYGLDMMKKSLVDLYKRGLPKGKPQKAYEQYAQVKQMYNDTLKNAGRPKNADKILDGVTATGETVKQFKKLAMSLKKPELVDYVKDNYLSNIFNAKNWKLAWEKASKNEPLRELVDKKTIDRVNLLLKYDQQMRSTMTQQTNPPRSGIIGLLGQKGIKGAVGDILFGETRQIQRALKQYEKIVDPVVKDNIEIPLRGARSAIGRTLTESFSNE